MMNKITKKSILGGKGEAKDHPNYKKAKALVPFKEEKAREDLVSVIANKKASQDQIDSAVSMYLFQRGKENASFLAELFLSKGQHTKETRAFKKQMRFDFEAFVDAFMLFLFDTSKMLREQVIEGYRYEDILIELADRFEDCSEMLGEKIRKITEDRMREKGYGIHLDKDGKPFDTFEGKPFDRY